MKNGVKEQLLYRTIIHSDRIKHNISNNDYCIVNALYHLSNNPKSKFKGWLHYGKMFNFLLHQLIAVYKNLL